MWIEPHLIQNCGVEIAKMHFAIDSPCSGAVGFPVGKAGLYAASGHPEGEAVRVVPCFVFAVTRGESWSAKFSTPDDECIFEQSTLIEVFEQSGDGAIGRSTIGFEVAAMVFMLIPTAMIEFDKADTGLGEATSKETLPTEIRHAAGADRRLLFADLVAIQRFLRFGAEVEQIRRSGLHAIAELHRANHSLKFGIARAICFMVPIQILDVIELLSLCGERKMGAIHVFDGGFCHCLTVCADRRSCVDRWQEGTRISRGARSVQTNEAGQVFIFRPETVAHPRAETGTFAEAVSGVQLQGRLGMDAGVSVHAIEDAELVSVLRCFRHQFRNPKSAFAVLLKIVNRSRMRFFSGLRFVVEGIELGWAP